MRFGLSRFWFVGCFVLVLVWVGELICWFCFVLGFGCCFGWVVVICFSFMSFSFVVVTNVSCGFGVCLWFMFVV